MEDQVYEQQTGVEEASAAEMQQEAPETNEVNEQTNENTGVEESEVAAQNNEKGFANALKAREEQIRAKLEQEYGAKAKDAERYQQNLDRIAKFYGYSSHDSYMAAIEQAEQERRIQEEAEKLGVDEEVIRNHLQPLNQKLSQYEKELNTIREQESLRRVNSEIESLNQKYSDFSKYQDQVLQMAVDRGYSLEDSYRILTWEDRMNTAKQEAQRETLKSIQQNAASSTGYLGADAPEQSSGYASMTPEQKKAYRDQIRGRLN